MQKAVGPTKVAGLCFLDSSRLKGHLRSVEWHIYRILLVTRSVNLLDIIILW